MATIHAIFLLLMSSYTKQYFNNSNASGLFRTLFTFQRKYTRNILDISSDTEKLTDMIIAFVLYDSICYTYPVYFGSMRTERSTLDQHETYHC